MTQQILQNPFSGHKPGIEFMYGKWRDNKLRRYTLYPSGPATGHCDCDSCGTLITDSYWKRELTPGTASSRRAYYHLDCVLQIGAVIMNTQRGYLTSRRA